MTTAVFMSELTTDNIALKLSKTQKSITKILEKYTFDIKNINEYDINNIMEYLSENSRRLNYLLHKNKQLSEKINTKLDMFSFYKKTLSKSQIKSYNEYISLKNTLNNLIKNNLSLIYNKNSAKELTNSILEINTNYNYIAEQLTEILIEQNKAIKSLTKIVGKANKLLKNL